MPFDIGEKIGTEDEESMRRELLLIKKEKEQLKKRELELEEKESELIKKLKEIERNKVEEKP